ncbi:MAG: KH domain-containing protein [Clostridia bacterium]|nr:KH domain-containing protein [Clostridia bacterium]
MEEIVKYIVDKLVENHDAVQIESAEKGDDVTITVYVAKQDMGKVIGRNGKIAQSIRAIIKTASNGLKKRYFVKFEERAE